MSCIRNLCIDRQTDRQTKRQTDAARFCSSKGKEAGASLNAISTSEAFALSSCGFHKASFLHLGLPISLSNCTTTCNCGADIDDSGYHSLTCKAGGGPVWSHESISSTRSDCFHRLQIHHRREPRNRYITTDNKPNIVFLTPTPYTTSILTSPLPTGRAVTSSHICWC